MRGRTKAGFRAAREGVGMTQHALARELGVEVRSVKRWESPDAPQVPPEDAWDVLDAALAAQRQAVAYALGKVDEVAQGQRRRAPHGIRARGARHTGLVGGRPDRAEGGFPGHRLGPGGDRPACGLSASRLPAQTQERPHPPRRMGASSCVSWPCCDDAAMVLLAVPEPVCGRGAVPWLGLWRLVVCACRIGLRRMLPPQAPEDALGAWVVVRGVAAGGACRR